MWTPALGRLENKKMKKRLYLISIYLFSILLLSGCSKFLYPIVDYSDAMIDKSLLGLWEETSDSNETNNYILILKDGNKSKYNVTIFDSKNFEFNEEDLPTNADLIYSGIFDNRKFIVVYLENNNSYLFWEYEIEKDILRLFSVEDVVFENAIYDKKIKGKISGEGLNKEILVEEKTENLQKFIKENKKVFDKSSFIEFKRVIE